MPATEERCGLCRFWPRGPHPEQRNWEIGLGGSSGSECRRRAPVLQPGEPLAAYPWVDRGHWCGEFERRTPMADA